MLHQTLIPTFLPFNPSPSSSSSSFLSSDSVLLPPPPPPHPLIVPFSRSSSQQIEMEGMMECRPETLASAFQRQAFHDDLVWAVEKNNLSDEFVVDDLLDLEGLAEETEKETEETNDKEKEGEVELFETENSNTSPSSVLSFEPPPLSELNLPDEDVASLEWVSRITYESASEFPPSSGVASYVPASKIQTRPATKVENHQPNLTAPTLMSTAVCSLSTEAQVPVKAKRSKRSRTAGGSWSLLEPPPFADSSSSTTTTTTTTSSSSSCSSSAYSSHFVYDHTASLTTPNFLLLDRSPPSPKKQKPKKRGRKPKAPPTSAGGCSFSIGERRCSHCGVQKTPQWRAGPLGAKTLCNACGVRYKSGRLLPEYRPACSPTFVSHVHSNSHRKVLEMRRKKEEELVISSAPPVSSF